MFVVVRAPSTARPPCFSPASIARIAWGLHASRSAPLGQSPKIRATLSRSLVAASGSVPSVVRSIASATRSSSFGSLHAPRHATMHMCALSDTTLGPKSCATSVGHAFRATHGENVRIDSPSHSAHSAAVARHASAWTAGCGSARARARDAEHVWKRRTTVAASRRRPEVRAAGAFAGSPASSGASSPRFSSGLSASGSSREASGSGVGISRSSRGPPGGFSSARLSERRPSVRTSWSRASAIRADATGSGGERERREDARLARQSSKIARVSGGKGARVPSLARSRSSPTAERTS